ncbi:LapA family protein [Pseudomonas sp. RTC3]|uniref:LapA family protein n=1 Tax=Pseudomonas sp. 5C2 TaxID=3048588 RepID=UPI002AB50E51|nr:LapA family protein [Pseudomonas sp. 5C2]MDY7565992.1 LapA family protein [Pseudomonas sp. 5C2]MEB0064151.1 LapA family protein [Pseudomonas sp. RTC3]MEB0239322.1 LapA family protein [Pseudomonas sp. 5C2]
MRNFKRVMLVVIILLIVLATVVFVLENQQPVSLVFLGWSAPELSVAVPVILALLIGMMIGPLLGWIVSFRRKQKPPRLV